MGSTSNELDGDRTVISPSSPLDAPRAPVVARPSLRQLQTQVLAIPAMITGRLQQLDQPRTVYILGDRRYTLGRDANCDLVLSGKGVSRVHAVVFFDGGHFLVEDQGSRNGVFVNGVAQRRVALQTGDLIRICEHEIRFEVGAAAAAASAPVVEPTRVGPAPMPTTQRAAHAPAAAPAPAVEPARAQIPTVAPFHAAAAAAPAPDPARRRRASISSLFALALSLIVVGVLTVILAFALGRASVGASEPARVAFPGELVRGAHAQLLAPSAGVVVALPAADSVVRRGAVVVQMRVPVTAGDRARWEKNLALARAAGETGTATALQARLDVADHAIGLPSLLDGTVSDVRVTAGATVSAGDVVLEIENKEAARIEVDVTALAPGRVLAGSIARVRWDGDVELLSVDDVYEADGARLAIIVVPQLPAARVGVRPSVEFP